MGGGSGAVGGPPGALAATGTALQPAGAVVGPDGKRLGKVRPDDTVVGGGGKVVGVRGADGTIVSSIVTHVLLVTFSTVHDDGSVVGPEGQILGKLQLDGTVVAPDGEVVGRREADGSVTAPGGTTDPRAAKAAEEAQAAEVVAAAKEAEAKKARDLAEEAVAAWHEAEAREAEQVRLAAAEAELRVVEAGQEAERAEAEAKEEAARLWKACCAAEERVTASVQLAARAAAEAEVARMRAEARLAAERRAVREAEARGWEARLQAQTASELAKARAAAAARAATQLTAEAETVRVAADARALAESRVATQFAEAAAEARAAVAAQSVAAAQAHAARDTTDGYVLGYLNEDAERSHAALLEAQHLHEHLERVQQQQLSPPAAAAGSGTGLQLAPPTSGLLMPPSALGLGFLPPFGSEHVPLLMPAALDPLAAAGNRLPVPGAGVSIDARLRLAPATADVAAAEEAPALVQVGKAIGDFFTGLVGGKAEAPSAANAAAPLDEGDQMLLARLRAPSVAIAASAAGGGGGGPDGTPLAGSQFRRSLALVDPKLYGTVAATAAPAVPPAVQLQRSGNVLQEVQQQAQLTHVSQQLTCVERTTTKETFAAASLYTEPAVPGTQQLTFGTDLGAGLGGAGLGGASQGAAGAPLATEGGSGAGPAMRAGGRRIKREPPRQGS